MYRIERAKLQVDFRSLGQIAEIYSECDCQPRQTYAETETAAEQTRQDRLAHARQAATSARATATHTYETARAQAENTREEVSQTALTTRKNAEAALNAQLSRASQSTYAVAMASLATTAPSPWASHHAALAGANSSYTDTTEVAQQLFHQETNDTRKTFDLAQRAAQQALDQGELGLETQQANRRMAQHRALAHGVTQARRSLASSGEFDAPGLNDTSRSVLLVNPWRWWSQNATSTTGPFVVPNYQYEKGLYDSFDGYSLRWWQYIVTSAKVIPYDRFRLSNVQPVGGFASGVRSDLPSWYDEVDDDPLARHLGVGLQGSFHEVIERASKNYAHGQPVPLLDDKLEHLPRVPPPLTPLPPPTARLPM